MPGFASSCAVIGLTKCECYAGCNKSRWRICLRNCLPCTPLYKCYTAQFDNIEKDETNEDDEEEISMLQPMYMYVL